MVSRSKLHGLQEQSNQAHGGFPIGVSKDTGLGSLQHLRVLQGLEGVRVGLKGLATDLNWNDPSMGLGPKGV